MFTWFFFYGGWDSIGDWMSYSWPSHKPYIHNIHIPKPKPGTHLSTHPTGRMNTCLRCKSTAAPSIQTQEGLIPDGPMHDSWSAILTATKTLWFIMNINVIFSKIDEYDWDFLVTGDKDNMLATSSLISVRRTKRWEKVCGKKVISNDEVISMDGTGVLRKDMTWICTKRLMFLSSWDTLWTLPHQWFSTSYSVWNPEDFYRTKGKTFQKIMRYIVYPRPKSAYWNPTLYK